MTYAVANSRQGKVYDRLTTTSLSKGAHRWIGRCKKCRTTHKVEGHVMFAYPSVHGQPGGGDWVIHATDGQVYYTSTPSSVSVLCGDHSCKLEMVQEGKKQSKHECGAKCTSATGPNCDCRCKGNNHGSNC